MSLLSQQSAINPTANFWAKFGAIAPALVPYVETSGSTNISSLIGDGDDLITLTASIPDSPNNVAYVVSIFYNLDSNGVDSPPFILGMQYNGSAQFEINADFKAGKGWATSSFTNTYYIAPNSGVLTLDTYIRNATGGALTFDGAVNWSVIAYPS
jgi:hypothetical protein